MKIFSYVFLFLFLVNASLFSQTRIQRNYLDSVNYVEILLPDLEEEERARSIIDSIRLAEQVAAAEAWQANFLRDNSRNIANQAIISNMQDSLALIAFYNATNGVSWATTWDLNQPVIDWHGVSLNTMGRVISINLSFNDLAGTLPAEIGDLSELVSLNLFWANISGSLPSTMSNLHKLEYLAINGHSELTGGLDHIANLRELEHLNLASNPFAVPFPSWIGDLTKLTHLDLSHCELTGDLPVELENLTQLQYLYVYVNKLTGLPDVLGNLSNLKRLWIGDNNFDGLPASLQNLSNLTSIEADGVPVNTFPNWLGNMTTLEEVYLGDCGLVGNFPAELENLPDLSVIALENNQLTGELPAWIGSLTNLRLLILNNNQFTGAIPTELENLTELRRLVLQNNQFSSCPDFTGKFPELYSLYLDNNNLSFDDLIPNASYENVGSNAYHFSPQNKFGTARTEQLAEGDSYTITYDLDAGITDNTYSWFKNGIFLSTTTTPSLSITNFNSSKIGSYVCSVTNPSLPTLTLESNAVTLVSDSSEPPVNDVCTGAITISVGAGVCSDPIVGSTIMATDSNNDDPAPPPTSHADGTRQDVWFKFTVPPSGIFKVEFSGNATGTKKAYIYYYTGECDDLTYSSPGYNGYYYHDEISGVYNFAAAGETVYMRVAATDENNNPDLFTVCIYEVPCKEPNLGWWDLQSCDNEHEFYMDFQIHHFGSAETLTFKNAGYPDVVVNKAGHTFPDFVRVGPFTKGQQNELIVANDHHTSCNLTYYYDGRYIDTNTTGNYLPCEAIDLTNHIGSTYTYIEGEVYSTELACTPKVPLGQCDQPGYWYSNYLYTSSAKWFSFKAPASGSLDIQLSNTDRIAIWETDDCINILDGTSALVNAIEFCNSSVNTLSLSCLQGGKTYYFMVGTYRNIDITLSAQNEPCLCEGDDIVLSAVDKQQYRMEQTITSTVEVNDLSTYYRAGESISLLPGFQAGKEFSASIESCSLTAIQTIPTPSEPQSKTAAFKSSDLNQEVVKIQVSPNPLTHSAEIQFYVPASTLTTVYVLDSNGQLLTQETSNIVSGWHTTQLDATSLVAGLYFVGIQTEKGRWMEKVVVVK